jgi:hypothetical protein
MSKIFDDFFSQKKKSLAVREKITDEISLISHFKSFISV